MKHVYPLKQNLLLSIFTIISLLNTGKAQSQSQCGPVVETFNNTSGSTAGFTGDFSLQSNGTEGSLSKDRVIASGIYSVTSPTYQLPSNADNVGYGFTINGSELIDRIEIAVVYISTLSGELTTLYLDQLEPTYPQGSNTANICGSINLSDLPGFPAGGRYRFRLELTPVTGIGQVGQTISFDDFRTNGTLSQAPLPVSFIGFTAKKEGAYVLLTWKIAGEENVDRYEVERSDDGRNFRTVVKLGSHGKDTYTHSDLNPGATAYYRIRNVDKDGKFTYSTIARLVGGKSTLVIKAFPQPVMNRLTLQHPAAGNQTQVTLSSAAGRLVKKLVPGNGSIQTTIDMSNVPKGLYLLQFISGEGQVETLKIMKQ